MSEDNTTEERHLSRERLHQISTAFSDGNSTLVKRALAVHDAIADGFTVKSIAADLAAAHRADDNITAVSAVHLGHAAAAADVASLMGITLSTWARVAPGEVADTIRAVKRFGKKRTIQAVRDALKPLADDASGADRREVTAGAVESVRAEIKPESTRPARPEGNTAAEGNAAAEGRDTRMTDAAALESIRAVTAHLNTGGAYTADLGTAMAELASAVTAARKRGAAAAARTARAAA